MELLDHSAVISYQRTGSSYTCNPPVTNTDEDWVVLVREEENKAFSRYLIENRFDYDSYEQYSKMYGAKKSEFVSWRPAEELIDDKTNLIVTTNLEWYQLFVEATEIAKEENLLTKEERVACFEMIMRKYRKDQPSGIYKDISQMVQKLSQASNPFNSPWTTTVVSTGVSTLWSAT